MGVKKIKVGLCGYGGMGRHHASLFSKQADVELVAVADAEPELRRQAAEAHGVKTWASGQEMIAVGGLDVVFVCVPTYLHRDLSIQAMEAGCDVFCEKPMALTTDQCREMNAVAERLGRRLMIGQVLRFWPEYIFLKEAIASKRFGALRSLTLRRVGGVSVGWERWFLDERRGGMQIFDRHIHDTDAVQWMLGLPESVSSFGYTRDPETDGGITHCVTRYAYPGNLLVCAEGSADLPKRYPFTSAYLAMFDTAAIEYSSRSDPTLSVYTDEAVEHPALPQPMESAASDLNISAAGPYFSEQLYFFDCLRRGVKPVAVAPVSAAETIRIVRAEIQSVRTGRPVELVHS